MSYVEFIYWLYGEKYGADGIAMADAFLREKGYKL